MLTTLAIAAFLAAPPAAKSDPFVARPVPAAKADPYAATELPQEHAGPLTAGDFLDERETKDLRDLAHALQIEQAADELLACPDQQRLILSAVLCEAQARKAATEERLAAGLTKPLARASVKASRDVEDAQTKLAVLALDPLACTYSDVALLVSCMDPAAPAWCSVDPHMAAMLAAAERIAP